MPFYTKKPIPIEARLITEENIYQLAEWCDNHVDINDLNGDPSIKIYTLEGVMTANVGDYLIKGVRGEFYPCKPDIFEETYEDCKEPIDPWHIEVLSIDEDSAAFEFILGDEALKSFARAGINKALRDQLERIIAELEEIDTNVGC